MNTLKRAGWWGWGLVWLGAPVHAQTPEAAPSVGAMTITAPAVPFRQFDKVEITGSAILAKEARQALPIQVLSQRDIAQSGATDLSTFLQRLPVMQNFTDSGMATGTISGGPETAAIHGNQSGTLVLLNGRRLPYYGSQTIVGERAVVDLNFIPLSAVEKIEILTDGASSRYGSDAVAGVVNVITGNRTQGLTLGTEVTLPSLQGGAGKAAHLSWGMGSAERDGHSLRAYLSLSQQDAVLAGWRPVSSEGALPVDIDGSRYWRFSNNTSAYSAPGQNYAGPNGSIHNSHYDTHGRCPTGWYPTSASGTCERNTQQAMTLYPATHKQQLLVQGERVLANHWLLSADVLWGQQTQDMVPSGNYYGFAQSLPDGSRTYLMDGVLWGLLQQRYTNTMQHLALGLKGQAGEWNVALHAALGSHRVERKYTAGLPTAGYSSVQVLPEEIGLAPSQYSSATQALFEQYRRKSEYLMDQGKSTLNAFNALMSRTLFDTDHGPVELGLGVDARQEIVTYEPTTGASRSRPPWDASRLVWAGFGELRWPVSERLETTLALRHDRYSDFGNVTTGKLGWKFRLTPQAWLRGSVGSGFRAPALGQLTAKQTSYIGDNIYSMTVQGNPALKPEQSRQWTLGGQWEPTRQWSLGADVWNLAIQDAIGVYSLDAITSSAALQARYQDPNNPSGFIVPNMNFGESLSRGIDYFVRWRQPTDSGRWQLALRGTLMLQSMQDWGQGMVSNLGVYTTQSQAYAPRHRLSLIPSFERNGWLYSAALHHDSGHTESVELTSLADGSPRPYTHRVAGLTTLDLAVRAQWDRHWDARVALLNVANQMPAPVLQSANLLLGVDSRAANYYGRRLQLKVQYRF